LGLIISNEITEDNTKLTYRQVDGILHIGLLKFQGYYVKCSLFIYEETDKGKTRNGIN